MKACPPIRLRTCTPIRYSEIISVLAMMQLHCKVSSKILPSPSACALVKLICRKKEREDRKKNGKKKEKDEFKREMGYKWLVEMKGKE